MSLKGSENAPKFKMHSFNSLFYPTYEISNHSLTTCSFIKHNPFLDYFSHKIVPYPEPLLQLIRSIYQRKNWYLAVGIINYSFDPHKPINFSFISIFQNQEVSIAVLCGFTIGIKEPNSIIFRGLYSLFSFSIISANIFFTTSFTLHLF